MSHRDGDTIWPHDPDTTGLGDVPVNNRPGDVWYLLVDEMDSVDIAWAILNSINYGTSWHIYPAIIPFIQQFLIKYIRAAFELKAGIQTNFAVCPIKTNFDVVSVLPSSISLQQHALTTSFKLNKIQTSFSLTGSIDSNFVITRVYNNTRTP